MAPEQLEGKEADARSDLWALGCVLYEMATGTAGVRGHEPGVADLRDHEGRAARRSSSCAPLSPPALERLVRACLAKDPDERWQTAHDVKLRAAVDRRGRLAGGSAGAGGRAAAHARTAGVGPRGPARDRSDRPGRPGTPATRREAARRGLRHRVAEQFRVPDDAGALARRAMAGLRGLRLDELGVPVAATRGRARRQAPAGHTRPT